MVILVFHRAPRGSGLVPDAPEVGRAFGGLTSGIRKQA